MTVVGQLANALQEEKEEAAARRQEINLLLLKYPNVMAHYHSMKKKKKKMKTLLQGDRKSTRLLLLCVEMSQCNGTFPLLHQHIMPLMLLILLLATRGYKETRNSWL